MTSIDSGTPRRPIRVLPLPVATRIAAGEVIERPASVVKELVENALDAGARRIRIDVRGGGLGLIRVGDDGCGISSEDLWLACQRHATSKLAEDNLESVQTLGFRGEALPSVAAVAELSLVSAVDERGVGRRLTLRDGQVVADEPAPRPRGTTVTVRHLFHNVPARLAAAARPSVEVVQIGQTVRRLALAAPEVRMSLYVEDRLVFESSGVGDHLATLIDVYGPAIAMSLAPLGPAEAGRAHLRGLVSGSEVTRGDRAQINLIVNGRWVQPRGLLALLETAYRPLLPRGRHPILLLTIEVPPDEVDINVHPCKLEVKLRAERAVGLAATALLREALGRRPIELGQVVATGVAALASEARVAEPGPTWEDEPIVTESLPPLRLVGQVQERLLLLEGSAGLYLVDQHRAHERVLYERFASEHGTVGPEPFALPEPLVFELRPAQVTRFSRRLDELAALGFEIEVFGGRSFLLRAAPALPGVIGHPEDALSGLGDADALIGTFLALAGEDGAEGEDWKGRLLIRLACRTAVRRGRSLDRPMMRALIESLGRTRVPALCPHGAPLLMHVSGARLEREFRWSFESSDSSTSSTTSSTINSTTRRSNRTRPITKRGNRI